MYCAHYSNNSQVYKKRPVQGGCPSGSSSSSTPRRSDTPRSNTSTFVSEGSNGTPRRWISCGLYKSADTEDSDIESMLRKAMYSSKLERPSPKFERPDSEPDIWTPDRLIALSDEPTAATERSWQGVDERGDLSPARVKRFDLMEKQTGHAAGGGRVLYERPKSIEVDSDYHLPGTVWDFNNDND